MSLRVKFGVLLGMLGLAVLLSVAFAFWAFNRIQAEVSDPLRSMAATLIVLGDAKVPVERARRALETTRTADPDHRPAADLPTAPFFHARVAESLAALAGEDLASDWRIRSGSSALSNINARLRESARLGERYATLAASPDPALAASARFDALSAFTSVHDLLERIEDRVARETRITGVENFASARSALIAVIGYAFLTVGLCFILGIVLIRRWVLSPVADLRVAAASIAAGEFGHRIAVPNDDKRDELQALSAEVNQMASMVQTLQDERIERERAVANARLERERVEQAQHAQRIRDAAEARLERERIEQAHQVERERAAADARLDRERLEQQDRAERDRVHALGEMIRRLAHNLRNPLGGIRTLAETTRSELSHSSTNADELRELQTKIILAIDRFEKWFTELLSATHPLSIEPEPTRIDRWLAGLADAHRPMAQARGVTLEVDASAGPAEAPIDPRHLEHALSAMISNAIESTSTPQARAARADGGHVRLRANPSALDENLGKWWTLSIEDEGGGIPPDLREAIFRPYFTTKRDGNGIGLAVALQVVKAHGGRIDVQSPWPPLNGDASGSGTAGRPAGARFMIFLPLDRPVVANDAVGDLANNGHIGAAGGEDSHHRG